MPLTKEDYFQGLVDYRDQQRSNLENLGYWITNTLLYIREKYGVYDLSNIELFEIRRNVKWVLEENYKLASDFNKKNCIEKANIIQDHIMRAPGFEAAEMFLRRYGLSNFHKPKFRGDEGKAFLSYLRKELFLARERAFDPLDNSTE